MSRAGGQLADMNQGIQAMPRGHAGAQPAQMRARTLPPPPPAAAGVKTRSTPPSAPAPSLAVGLPVDPVFFEAIPERKDASAWLQGLKYGLGAGLFVALGYGVALLQTPGLPHVGPALEHRVQAALAKPEPVLASALPAPVPVIAAAPSAPAAGAPLTAATAAAPTSEAQAEAPASQPKSHPRALSTRRATNNKSNKSKWHAKSRAAHAVAQTAASEDSDADSQDDVKTAVATQPTQPALPQRPSRDDVRAAIEVMRPALTACVGDAHGLSQATLTITGEGRVIYSRIDGAFVGTPEGTCMARTLRNASFPAFSGDSFRVRYPLMF